MPKFKSLLLGGFLAFSCVLTAQASQVIVFEHANLIDGVSPEPVRDATVVVRDGKIESLAHHKRIPLLPHNALISRESGCCRG